MLRAKFVGKQIPSTFIGEHEGFGKKVDLSMMAVRSARPLFLTTQLEQQQVAAASTTSATPAAPITVAPRPDPRLLTRYASLDYEQQLKYLLPRP